MGLSRAKIGAGTSECKFHHRVGRWQPIQTMRKISVTSASPLATAPLQEARFVILRTPSARPAGHVSLGQHGNDASVIFHEEVISNSSGYLEMRLTAERFPGCIFLSRTNSLSDTLGVQLVDWGRGAGATSIGRGKDWCVDAVATLPPGYGGSR